MKRDAALVILWIAALAPGCGPAGRHGVYEGVPASAEYPRSEAWLRAALACVDVHAMRRHAWRVFGEMTAPSRTDPEIARWETWYDDGETFPDPSSARGVHRIRGWLPTLQPDPEIPPKLVKRAEQLPASVVLYNREANNFILDHRLYLKKTFRCLQERGATDVPEFPREAIVLKADWAVLKPYGEVGIWDSKRPVAGSISSSDTDLPHQVCVADAKAKCAPSAYEFRPVTEFYHLSLARLDPAVREQLVRLLTRFGLLARDQTPEYLILRALHIATREQKEWVWATFWWHDRPAAGPFAEDRPAGLIHAPWDHYLMQAAYDMDLPREPDGTPHIAFNPYLEGFLPEGVQSNCMSCHRRAMWQKQDQPDADVLHTDGSITSLTLESQVVRGRAAATGTYLDSPFEEQLKLSFLWSLKHKARDEQGLTPCVSPPAAPQSR